MKLSLHTLLLPLTMSEYKTDLCTQQEMDFERDYWVSIEFTHHPIPHTTSAITLTKRINANQCNCPPTLVPPEEPLFSFSTILPSSRK
mmetsp:Transcript_362/g.1368  ORF Transcript_362/g.1368 Transcript_362/m.1368 type:complete len:88 (-) Transcript_362:2786-3049(-)